MTENWYQTLPKKRSASGVFLTNDSGHVLLVKPSYRDYWQLPGGCIDDNESPGQAAIREVREELGLSLQQVTMRCLDYNNLPVKGESYQFIFDGGVLDEQMIAQIVLEEKELVDFAFLPLEQAIPMLSEETQRRFRSAFDPKNQGRFVYLENGKAASDD